MQILEILFHKNALSPELGRLLSAPGAQITIGADDLLVIHSPSTELLLFSSDLVTPLRVLGLNGVLIFKNQTPLAALSLADLEKVARGNSKQIPMNHIKPQVTVGSDLLKIQQVLISSTPSIIVWQDTHLPYIANESYGRLTHRNPLDWVGDSFNVDGWASGELDRTMDLLNRHRHLTEHTWRIHRWGHGDQVFLWHGNIQKITLGGREARITQVLRQESI